MSAYRNASQLPTSRRVKACLGRLLRVLSPGLAKRVREKPFSGGWGIAGKFLRNADLADAVEAGDHHCLQRYHQDFWSSTAAEADFYDRFGNRFEDLFLCFHTEIVDRIADVVAGWEKGARVVEVGAGDGLVLAYLASRLSGFDSFIGIDLNPGQVAASCKTHAADSRLRFETANIMDWLGKYPAPKSLLFTNGGVFEYLRRDELLSLFRDLKESGLPCAVALTESVGLDHRFDTESDTYPYGLECALSHNYAAILREAGFKIRWERDRFTETGEENHPTRWFQIVAEG